MFIPKVLLYWLIPLAPELVLIALGRGLLALIISLVALVRGLLASWDFGPVILHTKKPLPARERGVSLDEYIHN